jgi:soluble lytic murein transglycosylase-like protein
LKKTTIGAILLCLICWAFPIKTLANTADEPKPKVEYQNQDYVSEDIIIKDNAIQSIQSSSTESIPRPLMANEGNRTEGNERIPNRRDYAAHSIRPQEYTGRQYTKEGVQQLIRDYSAQYGISADLPLRIANCESGFNQFAKNGSSTASGVYQWLSSSWANQPAGKTGVSVFDAEANIQAAVWLIAHNKISPWNASKSCWNR